MSTVKLNPGNIYQFTTANNSTNYIAAVNGTEIPFKKTFLSGIILARGSSTGSAYSGYFESDYNNVTLDNRGTFINSGTEKYGQFHLLNSTAVTMSAEQLNASGSIYFVSIANNNVSIELPSNLTISGSTLKFFVSASLSPYSFTINPLGTSKINGGSTVTLNGTIRGSIELIASNNTNFGYHIVSAFPDGGYWTVV